MLSLAPTVLLALARRVKKGGVIVNEHTLTRAQTRAHAEVLGRWFDFIRLEDLASRLGRRTRRPFCLLTFDDGKRSNFTEAAPELERLGVPAVFYVVTDFLSCGSPLWFDLRAQLIQFLGHCPVELELKSLKRLPLHRILDRVERACAWHQFKPGQGTDDTRPMSWEEARSLHRRGFTIGAHGVTHAVLTRETRERAFTEIEESLASVTRELGTPCQTFAFPNGNYTNELADHVVRCGAANIMTTEPMWADHTASLWRLPRVQLFAGFSRARIELKLALAAVKGALANPDGSGRGYRCIRGERRPLSGSVPNTIPTQA